MHIVCNTHRLYLWKNDEPERPMLPGECPLCVAESCAIRVPPAAPTGWWLHYEALRRQAVPIANAVLTNMHDNTEKESTGTSLLHLPIDEVLGWTDSPQLSLDFLTVPHDEMDAWVMLNIPTERRPSKPTLPVWKRHLQEEHPVPEAPSPVGMVMRYDPAGSTALMIVETVSAQHGGPVDRFYGSQCMGGAVGASADQCQPAGDTDIVTWVRIRYELEDDAKRAEVREHLRAKRDDFLRLTELRRQHLAAVPKAPPTDDQLADFPGATP